MTQRTERDRHCPLCGGAGTRIAELSARSFCEVNSTYRPDWAALLGIDADQRYPITKCGQCGFVYAGWVPPPEFLERVYETVIDPRVGLEESTCPARLTHHFQVGHRVLAAMAELFPRRGRLRVLDFGCGYGSLLRLFKAADVSAVGYDTSRRRVDHLRAEGCEAYTSLTEAEAAGPFEAVVMTDVLEHVPDPVQLARRCRDLLVDGGVIVANVPDFGSFRLDAALEAARAGARVPRDLNPWEHLSYFSPDTLARLLSQSGFVPLELGGPVDVGLRRGLRGFRRFGNSVKAAGRLLRYAVAGPQPGVFVVARRVSAESLEPSSHS